MVSIVNGMGTADEGDRGVLCGRASIHIDSTAGAVGFSLASPYTLPLHYLHHLFRHSHIHTRPLIHSLTRALAHSLTCLTFPNPDTLKAFSA
jgi:hypothetical protein